MWNIFGFDNVGLAAEAKQHLYLTQAQQYRHIKELTTNLLPKTKVFSPAFRGLSQPEPEQQCAPCC